jgi:hypothetical protein
MLMVKVVTPPIPWVTVEAVVVIVVVMVSEMSTPTELVCDVR